MSKKFSIKKSDLIPKELPLVLEAPKVRGRGRPRKPALALVEPCAPVEPTSEKEDKKGRGRPRLNQDPKDAKKMYVLRQQEKNRKASGKSDDDALVKLEESLQLLKEYKETYPSRFFRLKIVNYISNLAELIQEFSENEKLIDDIEGSVKENVSDQ